MRSARPSSSLHGGGIRYGNEVLKAIELLGAKCVFIWRPAMLGPCYKVMRDSLRCDSGFLGDSRVETAHKSGVEID
ncbi:hypothetical protein cypCar_00020822 [Cyprinus carpio]|nr:hypothetical protein cypCar_00020822 [Cyprinus carpio]